MKGIQDLLNEISSVFTSLGYNVKTRESWINQNFKSLKDDEYPICLIGRGRARKQSIERLIDFYQYEMNFNIFTVYNETIEELMDNIDEYMQIIRDAITENIYLNNKAEEWELLEFEPGFLHVNLKQETKPAGGISIDTMVKFRIPIKPVSEPVPPPTGVPEKILVSSGLSLVSGGLILVGKEPEITEEKIMMASDKILMGSDKILVGKKVV